MGWHLVTLGENDLNIIVRLKFLKNFTYENVWYVKINEILCKIAFVYIFLKSKFNRDFYFCLEYINHDQSNFPLGLKQLSPPLSKLNLILAIYDIEKEAFFTILKSNYL